MKNPEEFLESQEIGNLSIVDYISKEGYVWKAIVKAMFEYGKDTYNQALEDAAENAFVQDWYESGKLIGKAVNKQSILKLKKQ